jgi:capsular polysaccharide export protein
MIYIFTTKQFKGWGRKKTGRFALWCYEKFGGTLTLEEDGFIRSLNLGANNSPSFSLVEDDIGIYYDATAPSKLENILNTYDFSSDVRLLTTAAKAMALMRRYHISKYNNAPNVPEGFFQNDTKPKILVIAQTSGDASLVYGLGNVFSTKQMIDDAIKENPSSSVYIKIHPDVLAGKKSSDIKREDVPDTCIILDKDVNPISLLKHFSKVYTKTSGMGIEALVLGLEVVCYGLPYYAGWGLTLDKQTCDRRQRTLKVEELFAGAYILYTKYYNPYTQNSSDIIDTIHEIIKQKKML